MAANRASSNIETVQTFGIADGLKEHEEVRVTLDKVTLAHGRVVEHRISVRTYWRGEHGDMLPGKGVQFGLDALDDVIAALELAKAGSATLDAMQLVSKTLVDNRVREHRAAARKSVATARRTKAAQPAARRAPAKKAAAKRSR